MAGSKSSSLAHHHNNKSVLDTISAADLEKLNMLYFKPSYCTYTLDSTLALTNVYTKPTLVTSFSTDDITIASNIFTCNTSGIYQFNVERVYENNDKNPTDIVQLYLQMIVNGTIVAIDRTAPIVAATANDEPGINSFSTNRMISVAAGDTFYFQVKAEEGAISPLDTNLIVMEVTAHKVYNS